MAKSCCAACGKRWDKHNGISATCQELRSARTQLKDWRILFFVLCLKYLPPEMEFTPDNLLMAMLKKKR